MKSNMKIVKGKLTGIQKVGEMEEKCGQVFIGGEALSWLYGEGAAVSTRKYIKLGTFKQGTLKMCDRKCVQSQMLTISEQEFYKLTNPCPGSNNQG